MKSTDALEISFQLHSGPRVPSAAEETNFTATSGRLPRATQALALAIYFQDMIARGDAKHYTDLARLGGLSRERVSQIMRLVYLAPDIQVEILYVPPTPTGRFPISETSLRQIANLLSWTEQRSEWTGMKGRYGIG